MKDTENGAVEQTAALVKDLHRPQVIRIDAEGDNPSAQVIAVPRGERGGFELKPTTEFSDKNLERPKRRRGCATFATLASFIDHADRFKTKDSVLFGDGRQSSVPSLTAVYDYHDACNGPDGQPIATAKPDWLAHKAEYRFPLSAEWKVWNQISGKTLELVEFAEFLEDHLLDVMEVPDFLTEEMSDQILNDKDRALVEAVTKIDGRLCGSQKLLELSRGLQVHQNHKVEQSTRLDSGEGKIKFEVENLNDEGKPLVVPSCFLIAIPVFDLGAAYRVLVRLRYRAAAGSVSWKMDLHRPEKALDHALTEACEEAAEETNLPLFYGVPEH